jgi:hypothetical protein
MFGLTQGVDLPLEFSVIFCSGFQLDFVVPRFAFWELVELRRFEKECELFVLGWKGE